MNSRLLLLFLLIAGFIVIWSDDQNKTESYLASLQQDEKKSEFVLNCFPDNTIVQNQLKTLDLLVSELAAFDPHNLQSIDITIKECFPSALKTATLCPAENRMVQEGNSSPEEAEEISNPLSYLRTASTVINWMHDKADARSLNEEQLLLKADMPLMDQIADEIYKSIEEVFLKISIMAEDYQQTIEKIEKNSRIASEPEKESSLQ